MLQAISRIDDAAVREAAQEVFAAAEYNRVAFTDRAWWFIAEQFGRLVRWFFATIGPWIPEAGLGRWMLIALVAVLVLLAVWIGVAAWRQRDARRRREREFATRTDVTISDAERLAAEGRFTDAAHILYAALLNSIARHGHIRLHHAKTIGDYIRELRKQAPALLSRFREFARSYELVIYGIGECDRERFDQLHALALPLVLPAGTGHE